jgi:hypothetical protein
MEAAHSRFFDKRQIKLCVETGLDRDFWNQHSEFIKTNPRLFGYAIWKPQIILQHLNQLEEGEILVYLDAGCTLNPYGQTRFLEYLEMFDEPIDMLVQELEHQEVKYTKQDLINYVGYKEGKQRLSGIIFMRNTPSVRTFMKEWLEISCNYNMIDDSPSLSQNHETFVEHRHDQSVFSLLTKKYASMVRVIPDETWPTKQLDKPIWATRLKY